jgi:predicted alpha/beta superfamily hydrolase
MQTPGSTAGAFAMFSLLLCVTAARSNSPADGEAVSCGIYRRVHSNVLREDRVLLIRLPVDYGTGDKRYPVLYKLDGYKDVFLETVGTVEYLVDKVDRFPDYIVVAIENTDRNRDLSPERGAGDYDRFLKEELAPFIDENYRTSGFRVLCGQSLSSVFALYSFLREPGAFNGYVLSSFGLSPEWASLFEKELKNLTALRKTSYLYVANGTRDPYDEDGTRTKNCLRFLDLLQKASPPSVLIKYRLYDGEGHVPYPTIYDALKWMQTLEDAKRP